MFGLPSADRRQARGLTSFSIAEIDAGRPASQQCMRMLTCRHPTTASHSQVHPPAPCFIFSFFGGQTNCVHEDFTVSLVRQPPAAGTNQLESRYSRAGKPTTPAPPTPELPSFVTVVIGSAGQSCTALCQGTGRVCAQEHLAALNNCNILRQHFACEAGCVPNSHTLTNEGVACLWRQWVGQAFC